MIKRHRAALHLCSAAWLFMTAAAATAAEAVSDRPGTPMAAKEQMLDLAASSTRRLRISTEPGSYVKGLVESAVPVDLVLLGPDGAPERAVLEDATGHHNFYFVAGSDTAELALSTKAQPDDVTFAIVDNIPPDKQLPHPPARVSTDPESPALKVLLKALAAGGATEAFWQERAREGTPLVEPAPSGAEGTSLLTFLWRGAEKNVRLWGGPSGDHAWLERLGDSDVWFASFEVPDATRLSYRFAPDIPLVPGTRRERRFAMLSVLQADPLNKSPQEPEGTDRFNQLSYVELPDAPRQLGLTGPVTHPGTVTDFTYESERLGNARTVSIYRPAGFDPENPDNLLLFVFDGKEYQTRVKLPAMLDRLIAAGTLPPVVAVFVDHIDQTTRARELPCNADFADAVALELLPEIARRTGIEAMPARTAVTGSSYGGLASACIAHRHPERFGAFISLSGSFWWAPKDYEGKEAYVASLFREAPQRPIRAFLSAGIFETSRFPDELSIIDSNRQVAETLREKGYETVVHREYAGGHDYAIWRGALIDGLVALFAPEK
ncbi:enterochelin esterase [Rhodobium gokarnense]|uniref:Enterochelin esterase family protein n=1 Tax=Rhodobium gokarnense TaxID=364296 RepID=A0ABT3HBE5_9HYPH|nr:enterochelin esterase [Rhodobium gokarnense]MCW2307684.1 enterochelin esterase family protein [Rhodobium gokarnense]